MRKLLYICLLATVVCCWSCSSGGEEDVPTPTPAPESNKIEISTSVPVVEQKGETATVSFTTNAAWTASVGASTSWVTVSPTSGTAGTHTLTITAAENDTYDERNASITLKAGAASKNITVTQKQKDGLTVTSNKLEVGAEGGGFSIEAKANVSITYEIEETAKDWISASESRSLTAKTLNFSAKANGKAERRQGNITLKGGDGLTETVTVYQEGEAPTIVISSDDIVVSSEGDTVKIELKSNVEYTMILPEVDWISRTESRAISTYTHYLTIAPNDTYDQRNAFVYFQNEAENLKDSISITQLQKDAIIVAKNEYEVEAESSTLEFSVNTNVDFEVGTSVDWIKQNTASRALVENPLSFIIAENSANESREGTITISYNNLKQEIKVIQKGTIDYEAIERAALIEFYKAAGGDNWNNNTNWCSDKPLNEWTGIGVDDDGRVYSIVLQSNGLSGDIHNIIKPLSILTRLKAIDLIANGTGIYGTFPNEVYSLTNLEILAIDSHLEGELTNDICKLKKMKIISLDGVKVSASVFREICCSLTELESLLLSYSNISSPIPEEIGNLSKLKNLALAYSDIKGELPESLWNLPLEGINLQVNPDLTGAISPNIRNAQSLQTLSLDFCALSGIIPKEICECTNLEYIWLQNNKLEGNIPENIGNLEKLFYLELQNNNLTDNLPISMSKMTNLLVCNLYGNRLSGEVPEEISNMWQTWNPINMIIPQQEGYELTYKPLYASTDYSKDGEVQLLQKHTEGNGIPVILLGDAFVDKDMEEGGYYEATMKRAMEAYFSIEPMTSLRPLFDVYSVKCVSENNYIGANTALSSYHICGALGDADVSKCLEYALLVLDDLKDAQIKVIMNDQQQIGYCTYLEDNCTISFNTLHDKGGDWQNFEAVFRHEAIGHGFGLLADEYGQYVQTITEEEKESLKKIQQTLGHYLNIDVTNDSTQILWSKFLSDERYVNEDLGIYEGGLADYSHGVYRPSLYSIMRYNEPIFNAPSREAIYKRAMKLAYGKSWTYDYEEFVKFDEVSRNTPSRSAVKPLTETERQEYIKNHRPPTFIKGTWRDAMKNGKSNIVVPFQ